MAVKIPPKTTLFFVTVDIIYSEQGAGKGSDLAKADQKGVMDLAVRLDIHAAKKHRQTSDGEDCGSEKLDVNSFHKSRFLLQRYNIKRRKSRPPPSNDYF